MSTDPRLSAAADKLHAQQCGWDCTKQSEFFEERAAEILAAADAVDPLRQPGHVLEVRPTGYAIQHPPECRPNMLDCGLEQFMAQTRYMPASPGRYPAELENGSLSLGERLPE